MDPLPENEQCIGSSQRKQLHLDDDESSCKQKNFSHLNPEKIKLFRANTTGHPPQRRPSIIRKSSSLRRFSELVSTDKHNASDDRNFYGPYAHLRKELDYEYHTNYQKSRQWLQDSIIEDILDDADDSNLCTTPTEPWILFTVGAQGAGKKYTIRHLVEENHLPLLGFVYVDQDEIRRRLPEYSTYVLKSPFMVEAMTRKECGYICEILVLSALQAGRNVIVDGILEDPSWQVKRIKLLRQQYKYFKFGMIHVKAPREIILKRAQKESIVTGREIPEEDLDIVLVDLPHSIDRVRPHIDFYCEIRNHTKIELLGDLTWEDFQRTFLQTCAWMPGLKGKPKLKHDVSEEESNDILSSLLRKTSRGRKHQRSFSVLISSEENNSVDNRDFYGKYSHIRKTLDYDYHCNYTFERQMLQDAIITDMLDASIITDPDGKQGTVPTQPWIVFTAGAMGAGKSHTMNTLVANGRFPLTAFVVVDPDEIRRLLPEFHVYIEENAELAGELTRKEAGYIAEVLTLAALQAGKNVLQDGSLRDAVWYKRYFERLREEFPHLRQAILHVTAPREAIFQRAAVSRTCSE